MLPTLSKLCTPPKQAFINVLLPQRSQPSSSSGGRTTTNYSDVIAELLGHIVSTTASATIGEDENGSGLYDVALVARQISLVMVGVIIFSSIRVVFRGVTRALKVTSRNLGASLLLLLLAQLMVRSFRLLPAAFVRRAYCIPSVALASFVRESTFCRQ